MTSPPSANRQTRRVTALYRNSPDVFGAWTLRVRFRWSVDAALYNTSRGSTTTHTTRGLEHGPTSAGRRDGSKQLKRRARTHTQRASRESERSRAFYARRKSAGLGTLNDDDARFQRRSRRHAVPTSVHQGVCVCLTRDALLPRLRWPKTDDNVSGGYTVFAAMSR